METAIISGKGGTGKSSISACFATQSELVVVADCDVDAANLYILFNPAHEQEQSFVGGQKAVIDKTRCNNCGVCVSYCRFDAISFISDEVVIDETVCDGCQLCTRICPDHAIFMVDHKESRLFSGGFRNGRMVYGRLAPGEENSGKLVNLVRERAKDEARIHSIRHIIIDGPPGIGCPVISSVTGVDQVVVVTEPSLSGWHDMDRVLQMVKSFNLKVWVIINKYDLNPDISARIEQYCIEAGIEVAGKLPFDPMVVTAMVHCKSIYEWAPDSLVSKELKKIWKLIERG